MTKLKFAAVLAVACLGGASTIPSTGHRMAGKLSLQMTLVNAQKTIESLSDEQRRSLQNEGFEIGEDTMNSPKTPARGVWLKVGEDFVSCNEEGEYELPDNPGSLEAVEAYAQLGDAEPMGTVDLTSADPTLTFKGNIGTSKKMDGTDEDPTSLAVLHSDSILLDAGLGLVRLVYKGDSSETCACSATEPGVDCDKWIPDINDKTIKGCCQDFDGPFASDKTVRLKGTDNGNESKSCMWEKEKAFLGTVCMKWVRKLPCANEAGFRGIIEDNPNLPGCFANHRGRWCQHLDPDQLSVAAIDGGALKVKVGAKIALTVENNTPSNSTAIRLGAFLRGSLGGSILNVDTGNGSLVSMGKNLYRLDHFIDPSATPSNKAVFTQKMTIEYQAPDHLSAGETTAVEHLKFTGWGKDVIVDIEVSN